MTHYTTADYNNILNNVINNTIETLSPYQEYIEQIKLIPEKLSKKLVEEPTLQDIDSFLHNTNSIAFFFLDQIEFRSQNAPLNQDFTYAIEQFKNLKIALGCKMYLYYLECCKQKMLYMAVENYDALQYWHNENFIENLSFYKKNILRWFSSKSYTYQINDNIAALEKIATKIYYFLGLINYHQSLLLHAQNQQDFYDKLVTAITTQNQFLERPDYPFDLTDIGSIVKISIDQTVEFNQKLAQLHAKCNIPSHLQRNWKNYTVAAAGVSLCGYIALKYGSIISQGSIHFFEQHIKGPLQKSIEVATGYTTAPQLPTTEHNKKMEEMINIAVTLPQARGNTVELHEALVADCDAISNEEFTATIEKLRPANEILKQILQFKKDHPNIVWADLYKFLQTTTEPIFPDVYQGTRPKGIVGWGYDEIRYLIGNTSDDKTAPNLTATQIPAAPKIKLTNSIDTTIPDSSNWTFEEKKSYAEKQYRIIQQNPEKNLLRLPEYSFYTIEKEIQDSKKIVNKFAQDLHGTVVFAALIPMAVVIGGSLFASKNIYNSVVYQPIRKLIRKLEAFLNESFHQDSWYEKQGYLYFLTEQLKLHIDILTFAEQKMILEDIASLQNNKLDFIQKYNVVCRMYKTYPCLAAAGI